MSKTEQHRQSKPWYREPWPWVAIAIPGAAVIMGITTLILALNNPDPLMVDERTYQDISSGLKAQQAEQEQERAEPDSGDGER